MNSVFRSIPLACLLLTFQAEVAEAAVIDGEPWVRHTIDASSQGADGTRLADANGDGHPDIVTGWEEGGRIRAYLNPGPKNVKDPWPGVTIGAVESPEDAVFVDLDGDGALDVISSCEGDNKTIFVHWAPADADAYLDPDAWTTEVFPASERFQQWMFCLPAQVDGLRGVDLLLGSKNADAAVGWFESPENPRDLAAWTWHALQEAGWIMSLLPVDMDGDGDKDVLVSDRRGDRRGVYWLERPRDDEADWIRHDIGGGNHEVMFITAVPAESGAITTVLAPVSGKYFLKLHRENGHTDTWVEGEVSFPEQTGTGKAVEVGDIDLDGIDDLVLSCENAEDANGVFWLSGLEFAEAHAISGLEGTKYDLVVLYDMDADGDLDVLTCEERENLGVIWYENPAR